MTEASYVTYSTQCEQGCMSWGGGESIRITALEHAQATGHALSPITVYRVTGDTIEELRKIDRATGSDVLGSRA